MAMTTINQLFDNIHDLPQVPDVVSELISQVNNPKIDMGEIARNVEKEPTISLKILRLVNSAHYGLSRKVSSIGDALSFLGMSELKTLVIASGIVSSMPKINGIDSAAFWDMTFSKAFYAKAIAQELNLNSDIAFTAGLLSNIGTTLIFLGDAHAGLEVEQHVKASSKMRYEFEQSRLGFTSADVAAELSRRWKFPDDLVSAIGGSAAPLAQGADSSVAAVIHIAEYLSVNNGVDDDFMENFPSDVAERVGFTQDLLAGLLESDSDAGALSSLAA